MDPSDPQRYPFQFAPDGSELLAIDASGNLDLVETSDGGMQAPLLTDVCAAGFSPSGRKVFAFADCYFSSWGDLWSELVLVDVASRNALSIGGAVLPTPDAPSPLFSPDESSLAYRSAPVDAGPYSVEPVGLALASTAGPQAPVVFGALVPDYMFSPDSRWLAYSQEGPANYQMHLVAVDGSVPEQVFGSEVLYGFQFSPDSTRIAYKDESDVWVRTVAPGRLPLALARVSQGQSLAWVSDDVLLAPCDVVESQTDWCSLRVPRAAH